jgi:hypothetical protein
MPPPYRAPMRRQVVLVSVPRRDAAQRLSLAYCLLLRDLAEQPHPGPGPGAEVQDTPGLTSPQKEVRA